MLSFVTRGLAAGPKLLLLPALLLGGPAAWAQVAPTLPPPSAPPGLKEGLKTYLSPDSTTFLKLNFLAQTWVRLNESNPGTTVNGQLERHTTDVGIRRLRLVLSGQLTPRLFLFLQFGQNNFSYLSPRKAGSFFHDATADYALVKKHLSLGIGLNGWNGPARYANSSTASILGLDLPLFQEVSIDINDQFLRRMGVYAKGKLGKLDYRVSVGQPFVTQTASAVPDPISVNSTYSTRNPHAVVHSYFMYQFLDQESNAGAGNAGTYLGKKRVFNLGAGLVRQGEAMWRRTAAGDTISQALTLWAVDAFYDAPVNAAKGTAITAYGGYFRYDLGPGYIRNVGAMNPANGVRAGQGSFNGPGNNVPLVGTGHTLYAQTAYLLRQNLLGSLGTLQPYAQGQWSSYDRLADPTVVFDVGVNWLILGNLSKLSFNYQNRPVFTTQANGDVTATARRGEYVMQYQVAF
ncbi:hypothetical protein [Hymenobacter armeniacus]|uniref:Porin n=1 Tax=Hymenobacter armeniacus TaxID=2771358 RepID=A0ABR8JYC3_9BACT|nr:hypothetical protein [Hymenobacter armeniacus]MBD2724392.1 hypothetical protein [Hymenobacter armeniacus]